MMVLYEKIIIITCLSAPLRTYVADNVQSMHATCNCITYAGTVCVMYILVRTCFTTFNSVYLYAIIDIIFLTFSIFLFCTFFARHKLIQYRFTYIHKPQYILYSHKFVVRTVDNSDSCVLKHHNIAVLQKDIMTDNNDDNDQSDSHTNYQSARSHHKWNDRSKNNHRGIVMQSDYKYFFV